MISDAVNKFAEPAGLGGLGGERSDAARNDSVRRVPTGNSKLLQRLHTSLQR
eukprot:CAMPEP_0175176972 /NCGR_PEP_ID=MMETSP0087-20121206/34112_1 /TAXON_ID=136419 /ORGANISM="Unknown Unknown, Strain D1" /LENGTH=51 /DNA_ID=CAMNT_0016468867 /DNA_START=103 /DNA_END=254 /DNA_ORIENTATION=+